MLPCSLTGPSDILWIEVPVFGKHISHLSYVVYSWNVGQLREVQPPSPGRLGGECQGYALAPLRGR